MVLDTIFILQTPQSTYKASILNTGSLGIIFSVLLQKLRLKKVYDIYVMRNIFSLLLHNFFENSFGMFYFFMEQPMNFPLLPLTFSKEKI